MSGSRKRGQFRDSKTERIASMFTDSPMKELSPKDISVELGYDIRLVTTIVNRLMTEGTVERTGRGRYMLKKERTVDPDHIRSITKEMKELGRMVLGGGHPENGAKGSSEGFDGLVDTYRAIRNKGGTTLARNILRLAVKRAVPREDEGSVIGSMMEVTSE